MTDAHLSNLTPNQIALLEGFLKSGFTFAWFEKYARFIGVEKDGFVALLDTGEGQLRLFSQVGYRMGDEIGMLVERREGKAFVCHDRAIAATPSMLEAYNRFREDLVAHLSPMQ